MTFVMRWPWRGQGLRSGSFRRIANPRGQRGWPSVLCNSNHRDSDGDDDDDDDDDDDADDDDDGDDGANE